MLKTTQLELFINSCHVSCGLLSCFQRQSKTWYAARQTSTSEASPTQFHPIPQFLPQSKGVAVMLKPEPSKPGKQLDLVVRSPCQMPPLLIHCGTSLSLFSHL